ncbi:hypothetical protein N7447_004366 [Penicillium robsamsonii]|uniref:uncharacterized protein n=1 Tax=Penicillium robsamsonii TaxID=1792511 RepID=UPI0025472FFF|nr:uncharacterized protein N7447_004366 [Penicillium robsamsonii]KAJ5827603.1 hypothetical protein N7447_004366 [Penicillium robsamsonii]
MSNFARCSEGDDACLMNQQTAVYGLYGQPESHHFEQEGHDFNTHRPCFSQHSFDIYGSHFGQLSAPQSSLALGLQDTSEHSLDDPRLPHPPQFISQSHYLQGPMYLPRDPLGETEIESQESHNEAILLSEEIVPALSGFPDVKEFDQLVQNYIEGLSNQKQDKALIHAKRARNISTVLIDPKNTAVESAQFRFWVKKMFKLESVGSDHRKMICHKGKPVAIRQKLFKILTKAHQQCQHGGRDKTSTQVRRIYSWVPKELIARFVKICPTCRVHRGGSRLIQPTSRTSSSRLEGVSQSLKIPSLPISRQDSTFASQISLNGTEADYFSHLQDHIGWLDSHQNV